LDISELFLKQNKNEMALFQNMESKRQTDINRAEEAKVCFLESSDVDVFVNLYAQLIESQGSSVSEHFLDKMRNVIRTLLDSGLAKMFFTIDKSSQVTYACVFSHHQNIGCYLYGAGNRDIMRRFDATYCIWKSLESLSSLGVREVDLEGVNSPTRGQFKLGFGGELVSYYQVFKN
jgi:lipid II:glycine glycyltransferase (peptidoglycan interpeptide bridge formation enzyme)